MIFKQKESEDVVVIYCESDKEFKEMPAPEVGKIYRAFDDGKIRRSRLEYWYIDEAIDLDNDAVEPELLELLQDEIATCYWLYNKEQHIIYKATMVNEDGSIWYYKDDADPTECYFLRTQDEDWFGTGLFIAGLLDVDERYYNKLLEWESE